MGNASGLIRAGNNGGELLLANVGPTVTAVASPLTGYGTIGLNDSGCVLGEAIAFKSYLFQIIGPGTGYSVAVYGTIDPAARPNGQILPRGSTAVPPTSWFLLPDPSEQSGAGVVANPMVAGTQPITTASIPLVAVRVVVTAVSSPSGYSSVLGFAVP